MKYRRCPACEEQLPVGSGVTFDDENNVLCFKCGGIIAATTAEGEATIKVKSPPVKPAYNQYPGYGQPASSPVNRARPPWNEDALAGYAYSAGVTHCEGDMGY